MDYNNEIWTTTHKYSLYISRQTEHPVSVCLEKTENKRGIDGDVKIIIHNFIQRRAHAKRPFEVYFYLNLNKLLYWYRFVYL